MCMSIYVCVCTSLSLFWGVRMFWMGSLSVFLGAASASMTAYYQDAGVEAVYLSGAAYCGKSLQTWSCTPCKSASKTANIQSNAVRVFNSSVRSSPYAHPTLLSVAMWSE